MKNQSEHLPRLNPRVFLDQSATRYIESEGRYEAVKIMDISEGGARIQVTTAELGEPVRIFWSPVAGLPPLLLEGQGVWRKKSICGIRFVSLPQKVRKIIRGLVRYHRDDFEEL